MDKAGLVNESCATFSVHGDSDSSRQDMEQLMQDGWKVADLICDLANRSDPDLVGRRRIQIHARRCFARRNALILSRFRDNGGTLADVLRTIWRFRRGFSHIGIVDIYRSAWPIAIIILPSSIVAWLRHAKRTVQPRRVQSG
jgi:hypothetical protein